MLMKMSAHCKRRYIRRFDIMILSVNLASGYIDDPQKGYLLQSWLHVNGKDLSIGEAKEGMHSVSLEGVCITSNIDNVIQDSNARRYEYSVKSEDIPWIKGTWLAVFHRASCKKAGKLLRPGGDEGSWIRKDRIGLPVHRYSRSEEGPVNAFEYICYLPG